MATRRTQNQPATYLSFDGAANSYVALAATNVLPDATAACSGFAWIYLQPLGAGSTDHIADIIGNRRDSTTAGWIFKVSNKAQQKLEFTFFDQSAASQGWISNVTVPINRWTHVGFTFDGTQVIFYIDGNQDPKEILTTSKTITEYTGQNLRIGHRQAAGSTFETFAGRMAQLYMWTRAITELEATNLYKFGTVDSTSMAARWEMNEGTGTTISDSIGGFTGTLTGGVTWATTPLNTPRASASGRASATGRASAPTVQNKVLSLNGTSDFVTFANIIPATAAFSCSYWVKFKTAFVTNARVIDQQDAGPTNGFSFIVTATPALQITIKNVGVTDASPSSGTLVLDTWYHVVVSFKTNDLRYYVNNALVGTDTNCTMTAPAGLLTVGRRTSGSTNFCEMEIADLRMFNHALSVNEIYFLYSQNYAVGSDQQLWVTFNNTVNNQSGPASDGTLTGGTYVTDGVFRTRHLV